RLSIEVLSNTDAAVSGNPASSPVPDRREYRYDADRFADPQLEDLAVADEDALAVFLVALDGNFGKDPADAQLAASSEHRQARLPEHGIERALGQPGAVADLCEAEDRDVPPRRGLAGSLASR